MNPYQFFRKHAGYSYDPATQTPEQGRTQTARTLAEAERKARDAGISFRWEQDQDEDVSDFSVPVPADFPVQPLKPGQAATDRVTCGTCGRSWDDAIPTSYTPAPSPRCPFEAFHGEPYSSWICTAYICTSRDGAGTILASLGGIDFGRDGEPWGDPYRRVVEAELALEALAQMGKERTR